MNNKNIIAEYMGYKYVPYNNLQNFPKPGWFEKANQPIFSPKQGFPIKVDDEYYRYLGRNSECLKYSQSMDALLPVIKKLTSDKIEVSLSFPGGSAIHIDPEKYFYFKSFDKDLTWTMNTFNIIVETIKFLNYEEI